jgi:hypothetical protein
MKVKQVRLTNGCYALEMKDNLVASDHLQIEMLGGGNFLVKLGAKPPVWIHGSQVQFAICEPDEKQAVKK